MFLFEQFSRAANFYFLVVCVLQTIPSISITGGIPTTLLPLAIVLLFDALVTIREDWKRAKDDRITNTKKVLVARDGKFVPVKWQDVRVGNVLKILRGEVRKFLCSHCGLFVLMANFWLFKGSTSRHGCALLLL